MSDLKTTKTFAEQIEEIRIKKKMNKSECSTVLGVNVQTYWNWTSGRAAPDYDRANNLNLIFLSFLFLTTLIVFFNEHVG